MRKSDSQATVSHEAENIVCLTRRRHHGEEQLPAEPIPSGKLFKSRREITISHQGSLYRLRITRQGKLILHK